ncbi:MAG: DUF6544 family protein [Bryobacterales bacterium]|nr:DUF6544 family protein [Bryobacterales bacterium]
MPWLFHFAIAAAIIAAALWRFWRSAKRDKAELARVEATLWPPGSGDRPKRFQAMSVDDLPEPAARYLRWSIAEGAPLAHAVRLQLTGSIRLARGRPWIPIRCEETLHAHRGFVWKAATGGNMRMSGFDRYFENVGEMNWRLFGLVPVMRARDPNISRSALHRFLMEWMLAPAALLPSDEVEWAPLDDRTAILKIRHLTHLLEMVLTVDPEGMPRKLSMLRWGNFETDGGGWQEIPYAVRFEGVYRNGGYTLPHEIRASWWAGTDRELEVVNLEIAKAEFGAFPRQTV